MYFAADDGAHGSELWASDGTGAGTVLIRDIKPGKRGSTPHAITKVGGRLFFVARDDHGFGLMEVGRHKGRHRIGQDPEPRR